MVRLNVGDLNVAGVGRRVKAGGRQLVGHDNVDSCDGYGVSREKAKERREKGREQYTSAHEPVTAEGSTEASSPSSPASADLFPPSKDSSMSLLMVML